MSYLGAPVRVSPFIKLCRWSAFIVGLLWGKLRRAALAEKEELIRELQDKQMKIRKQKKKMAIGDAIRAEMLYLGSEAGVPTPPYFDESYPKTDKAEMERLCREEEEFYRRYEAFHGVLLPSREVCEQYGIELGPKAKGQHGEGSWCPIM